MALKPQRPSAAGPKPGTRLRDYVTWPPAWGGSYKGADKLPVAEEGILKDVELIPQEGNNPAALRLTIDYDGNRFSGVLQIKNRDLLAKIQQKLEQYRGQLVRDIANLEVN